MHAAANSDLTDQELENARQQCVKEFDDIRNMNGKENAHQLHHEMGDIMYKYVSIERDNRGLKQCMVELQDILKRWNDIGVTDHGTWANQEAMFVRQLRNMILYAMVITKSALCRDESRGAHAKIVLKEEYEAMSAEEQKKLNVASFEEGTDRALDANGDLVFYGRNDKRFMKTSLVDYDPETELPQVSYIEFEHSLIKPRPRNYAVAKKE